MIKSNQLEPLVGIFWLVGDRLIIDASLLSEAESYGDCLTHRTSHIDFWAEQQRLGTVPRDIEYEENPRGRVTVNAKAHEFYLLADRCILKDKVTVAKIRREMRLPANTIMETDLHYRCPACLRGRHLIDDSSSEESPDEEES